MMKISGLVTAALIAGALSWPHAVHAADKKDDKAKKEAPAEAKDADEEEEHHQMSLYYHKFSSVAHGGFMLYRAACADCHGVSAQGKKDAPALVGGDFSRDYADRAAFHEAFRKARAKHRAAGNAVQRAVRADFNDLEMMARFLREFDHWERKRVAGVEE